LAPLATRPGRIAALDAARAVGVVAMVFGHTLDALLAPAVRAHAAIDLYWKARGLTAPLFLVVSGWAVTVAIRRSGACGLAVPRGRLPRIILLLGVAYLLRWPGWGLDRLLAGDRAVWAHLLAFDPLHTIAVALLAAACVLGLHWTDREKAGAFAFLAAACLTAGLLPPAPAAPDPSALPSSLLALALAQAAGGTSPFPLFPWGAYFFAGAILALVAPEDARRRARALALVGGALAGATFWTGVGVMPMGHPLLVGFRIGAVLLVLAALSLVPPRSSSRLALVGRASLGVYAIHVPIVYGWSTHDGLAAHVGATLSLPAAIGVALSVLAASFGLFRVARALAGTARWAWERLAVAVGLIPAP
jgi:peptidoglycan/LPS O-acetylase OafA/YrhL